MEQKGKVFEMLRGARRIIDIASYFKVNESTIRIIGLNSEKVQESRKFINKSTDQHVRNFNILLNVDKLLAIYVRRQEKSGDIISRYVNVIVILCYFKQFNVNTHIIPTHHPTAQCSCL